jgi:predicted GTPase
MNSKVLLVFNSDSKDEKVILCLKSDIEKHIIEHGVRVKIFDLSDSKLKVVFKILDTTNKEGNDSLEKEEFEIPD